jgi:hypothetical protein
MKFYFTYATSIYNIKIRKEQILPLRILYNILLIDSLSLQASLPWKYNPSLPSEYLSSVHVMLYNGYVVDFVEFSYDGIDACSWRFIPEIQSNSCVF